MKKSAKKRAQKQSGILSGPSVLNGNFDLSLDGASKQKKGKKTERIGLFDPPSKIVGGDAARKHLSAAATPPSEFLR